jgi:hypothetical protein
MQSLLCESIQTINEVQVEENELSAALFAEIGKIQY